MAARTDGFHGRSQALDLFAELTVLDGPRESEDEVVHLEGLRDEIIRTGTDRPNRGLHTPECRNDDDGHARPPFHRTPAELQSVHSRHLQIGSDRVELLIDQCSHRVDPAGLTDDLEAPAPKRRANDIAHRGVVIDEEHPTLHVRHRSLWGDRR